MIRYRSNNRVHVLLSMRFRNREGEGSQHSMRSLPLILDMEQVVILLWTHQSEAKDLIS